MLLGVFQNVWTPKVIGALLVLFAFHRLSRITSTATAHRWAAQIPCWLLALNPAFVIWTSSGLENALYAALLAALLDQLRPGASLRLCTWVSPWRCWDAPDRTPCSGVRDARFKRDYVPILVYEDQWVRKTKGFASESGVFVRRAAIGDPNELDALLARVRSEPLARHAVQLGLAGTML